MIFPPTFNDIRDLGNYGGVLMFIHWGLSQSDAGERTLGELLVTGLRVCNLPVPSHEMEQKLLKAAYKLTDESVAEEIQGMKAKRGG
jgi:hypothetical protein